jgi:hypothetical protein
MFPSLPVAERFPFSPEAHNASKAQILLLTPERVRAALVLKPTFDSLGT